MNNYLLSNSLLSILRISLMLVVIPINAESYPVVTNLPEQLGDTSFLSKVNPLATEQQRELDELARKIVEAPAMVEARKKVEMQWRSVAGQDVGEQAWSRFDQMIDEYVYLYAQMGANSDPDDPKIGFAFMPPHQWFGENIPGGRAAGANMDNIYRYIPLDANSQYELKGYQFSPEPLDFGFTLMSNIMTTRPLPLLVKRDLHVNPDGSFTITIGPEPAMGRPNHLQTTHDTRMIFIRDTLGNWAEVPHALKIRKVSKEVAPGPKTFEQKVQWTVENMIDDIPKAYWWVRISLALPKNYMRPPRNTGGNGGLANQDTSFGVAELKDDEAFLITVGTGGATYHSLGVSDYWYNGIDPEKYMTNLNSARAKPNPDGNYTYVISKLDPGIYNWVQTAGLEKLLVILRWQGIPEKAIPGHPVSIDSKVVKLAELEKLLPREVPRITPKQRKEQLETRLNHYLQRYADF